MRYLAAAVDYDGAAANDGELSDPTASAMERLRTSGRRVVLVTGRRVRDLLRVCPRITLFDLIVAENGGVLYDPQSREEIALAALLPARFAERLRVRGVAPPVHPDHLAPAVLAPINVIFAIGQSPEDTLKRFAGAAAQQLTWPPGLEYEPDSLVAWFVADGQPPFSMQAQPARAARIRHHRKYAEGDLRWHSFYFRGPDGEHNLKAQNVQVFSQLAEGIDEPTWMFH